MCFNSFYALADDCSHNNDSSEENDSDHDDDDDDNVNNVDNVPDNDVDESDSEPEIKKGENDCSREEKINHDEEEGVDFVFNYGEDDDINIVYEMQHDTNVNNDNDRNIVHEMQHDTNVNNYISCIALNAGGVKSKLIFKEFTSFIEKHDIICISESKLSNADKLLLDDYTCFL